MLQALRFVIQGAGAKVDAAIRKNIVSLLLSMLGHDEVWLWVCGYPGSSVASPFSGGSCTLCGSNPVLSSCRTSMFTQAGRGWSVLALMFLEFCCLHCAGDQTKVLYMLS